MRIRWERIVGLILLGLAVYFFRRLWPLVEDTLDLANTADNSNPIKVMMLGVMCVAFVAGIKLLTSRK